MDDQYLPSQSAFLSGSMAVEPAKADLAELEELTASSRAETLVVKPGEDPTEEVGDKDDPADEDDEEAQPVEAGGAAQEGGEKICTWLSQVKSIYLHMI